jgi:putative holliday junction resolvase
MRALAIDWGTVRIGVAMSDEEQKLSFPLQHTLDAKTAVQEIKKLTEEYEVDKIVVGLPTSLKGGENESTSLTRKFAEKVSKATGIEPTYVDERFSSLHSGQALQEQGIKEIDQRHIKDNIAAALMLQKYLDTNKKN